MVTSFIVTFLIQAATAADCAYPQLKNCELPAEIKSCIFPTLDTPCKAKATVSEYPLMATANSQQPAAGCYSLSFVRQNPSTYDAAGKCSTQNFPLHLTINYKTKCLDTQTSCVVGASVEVYPTLVNEHENMGIGSVAMNKMDKVIISKTSSGDPVRDACTSMTDEGYEWDDANRKCIRNGEYNRITCQSLSMLWDGTKCLPLCESGCDVVLAAPPPGLTETQKTTPMNKLYCNGYIFFNSNPGKNCACQAIPGAVTDINGLKCGGS